MASTADNLRGASWIVLSAAVATVMSAGVHELAGAIHSFQVVFMRGLIGCLIAMIAIFPRTDYTIRTRHWKLHIIRGLIGLLALNLGFYSLMILPLVTVTALFFTAPLFVTALSVPILGEQVGLRRTLASVVGFFGAMLVIGFSPQPFTIEMLAPICASLAFSTMLLLGKKLSAWDRPGTLLFYFTMVLTLGSCAPAYVYWTAPTYNEWMLLLLVGLTSSARSYFDIRGYAIGEANFIAPFSFARMIFMALVGYFVFAEIPSRSALIGAALIMLCTFYIAQREAKLRIFPR